MYESDILDRRALTAAKQYMGKLAWPTVLLGVTVGFAYVAIPLMVVTTALPLAVAIPVMAILTYAAYTVLHEAVHGSISGGNTSMRWLNEALGYMAAWILMIPLTAHRHEHLAHHRNTNNPESDPDFVVSNLARARWYAPLAALQIFLGQFSYYRKHRWSRGPRSQDVRLCLEIFAALLPRLLFVACGYWLEAITLFGVAWLIGVGLLMFLFAYIVHTPHESEGRYVDTATFVVRGWPGHVVTTLWAYQNFHSIHHLFPRVPFYYYRQLFDDIEDTMIAKGAPIYSLGASGIKREPEVAGGMR